MTDEKIERNETYAIAVYEADRAYGGPEEGGWHYKSGTFIRELMKVSGWSNARDKMERANRLFNHLARAKRGLEDPFYNGGIYFTAAVLVAVNGREFRKPPVTFPDQPPKYKKATVLH